MDRREFIGTVGGGALAMAAATGQGKAQETPPNVVFILIDDMGWRDLTCYGSGFYETPNIDRLAAEGMLFTDAYAACPVCSPTRAAIMSGKYPARVGVTNYIGGHREAALIDAPYTDHLPADEVSLAAALREGGYSTWHVGKWHLGGEEYWPENHGFDENVAGCHMGHPWKGYFSPYQIPTLEDGPEGEYLTDRLTDETVRLIENQPTDVPFYLNLWHYTVHTPIQAKPEDIAKYEQKAKDMGIADLDPIEVGETFPFSQDPDHRVRRRKFQSHPVYAAMIDNLDQNIGRVFDALERTGRMDDTLIVFTSDNGGLATSEGSPTCNAPLAEGKGWMYEGGTREPLLIRWPGRVEAGSSCDVPVTSTDFYPTLLEAAGLPPRPQQHMDGVSLMPLLSGGSKLDRDAIFWHYPHYGNQGGTPGCSVRMGDHKLIEFFEDGRLELYNLREDISEEQDLAATHPRTAGELHDRLMQWRQSVEALVPERNPDW
jgi:arylsulfatase A-like enzyme